MQVDIGISPSGDVWVTNNWQYWPAEFGHVPEALSTLGGGSGVVIFFGMATTERWWNLIARPQGRGSA